MKNTIIFFVGTFIVFGCNNSNEIGGIKGGVGKEWRQSEAMKSYKNRPRTGMKATFMITHKNIDLTDYDILIDGIGGYYYYGTYQKEISLYLPDADETFCTNLIFRIIDKKTDSLYYFTSDMTYDVFQTNKPIKVKLLPDEYRVDSDSRTLYKLKGCPLSSHSYY